MYYGDAKCITQEKVKRMHSKHGEQTKTFDRIYKEKFKERQMVKVTKRENIENTSKKIV